MANENINNKLYKEQGIILGLYLGVAKAAPIDNRMVVSKYADLTNPDVWKLSSTDPNVYVYKGMMVVVANDTITNEVSDKNGGKAFIYIGETASSTDVALDSNWVKASSDDSVNTALTILIGDDSNQSVRAIAQDVVNNIANWQTDDVDTVINKLKDIISWFDALPEELQGALNLINKVGSPAVAAVYYTQEEATAYNTEHSLHEGDEGYVTTETIKTPAVASTGLYAIIDAKNATGTTSDTDYLSVTSANNTITINLTQDAKNKIEAGGTSLLSILVNDGINTSGYTHILSVLNDNEIHYKEAVVNNNKEIDNIANPKAIVTGLALYDYVHDSINWIES